MRCVSMVMRSAHAASRRDGEEELQCVERRQDYYTWNYVHFLDYKEPKFFQCQFFPSNKLFSVPLQLEKRLLPVQDPLAYHL